MLGEHVAQEAVLRDSLVVPVSRLRAAESAPCRACRAVLYHIRESAAPADRSCRP